MSKKRKNIGSGKVIGTISKRLPFSKYRSTIFTKRLKAIKKNIGLDRPTSNDIARCPTVRVAEFFPPGGAARPIVNLTLPEFMTPPVSSRLTQTPFASPLISACVLFKDNVDRAGAAAALISVAAGEQPAPQEEDA